MKPALSEGIDQLDWHDHIHSDPEILSGKPVVKGTRISVELLANLIEDGWTDEMILENYPRLTAKDIQAVKQYPQQS